VPKEKCSAEFSHCNGAPVRAADGRRIPSSSVGGKTMCRSRLLRCCLVALLTLMYGLPAWARTPDGQTPAEENWCNPLKDRGVTRGLYGLCVAYCEAHDSADELATTQTRGGPAARGYSSRSERILANYNKMMKAGDPELPCLVASAPAPVPPPVAQPCPCWTAGEAGAIDGVLSDGSPAVGWPAPTSNSLACSVRPENPYIQETDDAFSPNEVAYIQVVDMASTFSSLHQCKYRKIVPGQPVVDILLSIEWGTLTAEDHAACKADILARQRALNLCQ
jgi:hypothetical protein